MPYLLYFSSLYLLISYYTMCISAGCHLLYLSCSCILVLTTRFSMCVYDSDLSIHVCLSLYAISHSHHHLLGSSDSPGSSCPGPGAWGVWILPVADRRSAAVAWISSRPSEALSFLAPCASLDSPSVTREHHLYCSYLYISLYSHIYAYR